jgi:polyhydroxyalkanoate synthase
MTTSSASSSPHFGFQPNPDTYRRMDRYRLAQRDMLDLAGFGPHESPFTILHSEPGLNVRRYSKADERGPVLLIVPAPIKRPYIWDIAPEASVIRRCLAQGMQVYLAEWTQVASAEHPFGLDDYADRLLSVCTRVVAEHSGEAPLTLAGHSLGGVLAAMHACLHPQHINALVLLESPLHFGADAGSFAPLVASVPDTRPMAEAFGDVPGSFLNTVSAAAAPHAFQLERFLDRCLCSGDPVGFKTHMRVERWSCDEFPLPGRLFHEIVEQLYRNDDFMQGRLSMGGRTIGPRDLKAALLCVVDPRSRVIPPESVLPFQEAAASWAKEVMWYEGDTGVAIQHVGVLVGSSAHCHLWPRIFAWIEQVGS